MRESNFAFPAQNRACVCISSQLYDRRALDTSSPLPLFNSLSHLTYLTSTSPRIREILTFDGGLERLVRILRDFCTAPPPPENAQVFYGLAPPLPYNAVLVVSSSSSLHRLTSTSNTGTEQSNTSLAASASAANLHMHSSSGSGTIELTRSASVGPDGPLGGHGLQQAPSQPYPPHAHQARERERERDRVAFDRGAAYRFSLAFQCVANIGVRGSEPIRSRVVQAGTLDVVGCVLESWLKSKGFAVMPSSSASGMPRETKEQRLARRQAQQAAELQRALELAQAEQMRAASLGADTRQARFMQSMIQSMTELQTVAQAGPRQLVPAPMIPIMREAAERERRTTLMGGPAVGQHQRSRPEAGTANGRPQQDDASNTGPLVIPPYSANNTQRTAAASTTQAPPRPQIATEGVHPHAVSPAMTQRRPAQPQPQRAGTADVGSVAGPSNLNLVRATSASPTNLNAIRPASVSPSRPTSAISATSGGSDGRNGAIESGGTNTASASASDEEMADERYAAAAARAHMLQTSTASSTSAASPETSAAPTPTGPPLQHRERSATVVRRRRTVTQRDATDTEDDGDNAAAGGVPGVGARAGRVGIVGGEDAVDIAITGVTADGGLLLDDMGLGNNMIPNHLQTNDDLAMGAPPGAPGATPALPPGLPPQHLQNDADGDESASNMAEDGEENGDADGMDVDAEGTVVGGGDGRERVEETPRVEATPRVRNLGLPAGMATVTGNIPQPTQVPRHSTRSSNAAGSSRYQEDGPYREEDVLIALQLLAYLSKYPHVRQAFYKKRGDVGTVSSSSTAREPQATQSDPVHHRESSLTGFARSLVSVGRVTATSPSSAPAVPTTSTTPATPANIIPNAAPLYPRPPMTQAPNIFSLVERFTFRPSANEAALPHPPEFLPPEIQYWAGVIMRNACRKDDSRGGIRQCANMLCGRWEESPRQFAKCRRCRKAKYCGKECQSRAWAEGHRFWCSAREEDETGAAAAGVAADAGPAPVVVQPLTDAAVAAAAAFNPAAAGAAAAGPTITGMGRNAVTTATGARPMRPMRAPNAALQAVVPVFGTDADTGALPNPTRVRREINLRRPEPPLPLQTHTFISLTRGGRPANVNARQPVPGVEAAGRRRAGTEGSPVAGTSRLQLQGDEARSAMASPAPGQPSRTAMSTSPSPAPPGSDDMVLG